MAGGSSRWVGLTLTHVVLRLCGDFCAEAQLLGRCEARGIRLLPFSAFYASGEPEATHLILGFGGMTAADIETGISLLAQTMLKL